MCIESSKLVLRCPLFKVGVTADLCSVRTIINAHKLICGNGYLTELGCFALVFEHWWMERENMFLMVVLQCCCWFLVEKVWFVLRFRFVMFESVCFLCVWFCVLTKVCSDSRMANKWLWAGKTSVVTHDLMKGHLNTSFGDWWTDVCLVANTCTKVSPH